MTRMKRILKIPLLFLALLVTISLFGCYPALKKEAERPEEALGPVRLFYPKFSDDMDRDSLILATERNLEYLNRLDPETIFHYGSHKFSCEQVRQSQRAFLNLLERGLDADGLNREIKKQFQIYRAKGRVGNRRVLFTGYYEPEY